MGGGSKIDWLASKIWGEKVTLREGCWIIPKQFTYWPMCCLCKIIVCGWKKEEMLLCKRATWENHSSILFSSFLHIVLLFLILTPSTRTCSHIISSFSRFPSCDNILCHEMVYKIFYSPWEIKVFWRNITKIFVK